MEKISALEFYAMFEKNPSVFEHWETPLEITEYVDCRESKLTHLSKHLLFSGRNEKGWSARFESCPNLKIVTGTFHGFVWFLKSGIEKIENLQIKNSSKEGWSASFRSCSKLEIATGTYENAVCFSHTGVRAIENLNIEKPNLQGRYALFTDCCNLHTLEGWDLSKRIGIEYKKLEAEIYRRKALKKFIKVSQPPELPFL
jgi:hypothetical protein